MRNVLRGSALMLALLATVALTGCGKHPTPIPVGEFLLTAEDVVTQRDVVVKRVTIEAYGQRLIRVTEKGGLNEATVSPPRGAERIRAEVTLVAMLVKTGDETRAKWLVQLKAPGLFIGGPSAMPSKVDALDDLIQWHVVTGSYPLKKGIILFTLQGEPVVLTVQ